MNSLGKNAIFCLLFVTLGAMMMADSGEAAHQACLKCEPTLPSAKDKNSSGGGGGGGGGGAGAGVIKTIRVALKPDREGISNANIYHGGAVVTVPMTTTTAGLPPPPPVMSYATMVS